MTKSGYQELVEFLAGKFSRIDEHFARIDEHFARIDEHFARIDEHFEQVEARLERLDRNLEDFRREVATEFRDQRRWVRELNRDVDRRLSDMEDLAERLAGLGAGLE